MRGLNSGLLVFLVWVIFAATTILSQDTFLYAGLRTEMTIISFISAFASGVILTLFFNKNSAELIPSKLSNLGEKLIIIAISSYILVIAVLFFRIQFYSLFLDIQLSRAQIYSPDKKLDGVIFSAFYVVILYVKGVAAVFSYFAFVRYSLLGKRIIPTIIVVLILLDAFVFQAKGPLIELGFLLLVILLFQKHISFFVIFRAFFGLFLISIPIYLIIGVRENEVFQIVLNYFSIGPILLSKVIDYGYQFKPLEGKLENLSIILAGLDYLICLPFRVLGFQAQTFGYDWVKMLNTPLVVSQQNDSFVSFSSFFTILVEPYVSLGIYGVICLGFALGFSLKKLEDRIAFHNCDCSLFWFIYLFKIAIFGIFTSPFSSVIFWLIIIFMLFFSSFIFKKLSSFDEKKSVL